MTKLILNKDLLAKLGQLRERTELCDEDGRAIGVFQPDPSRDRSLYEGAEIPVSEEELQRAEQDPESFTTSEVLAYLEKLPCTPSDGSV